MKTLSIFLKSLKEQIRSYWVLLLSLSMGPFFIFVYFLILETSKPQYTVLIANMDQGIRDNTQMKNRGNDLVLYFKNAKTDAVAFPFVVNEIANKAIGVERLKIRKPML